MTAIKYFFLTGFALSSIALKAQNPRPAAGDVPEQNQDVIKNFDARLIDAEKFKITPYLPAVDTATKSQTYIVPNRTVPVAYLPPRLRPIAMKAEGVPDQYLGYAKLGYGYPNMPFAEGAYHLGQDKVFNLDLHGKYTAADYKPLENQKFSYTGLDAKGSYFLDNGLAVDGKLAYTGDTHYLYGYDHTKYTYTNEQTKQFFHIVDAGGKIYNSQKNSQDFNWNAGANFYTLSDNFGTSENDLDLKGEATKWFDQKHPLTVILRTDFTSYNGVSDTAKSQSLNNIYLKPSFTYHADFYRIKFGANLVSYGDNFYILPDVDFSANILGNQLNIFGGWTGDLIKNSYRNLTAYNPYLEVSPNIRPRIENTRKTEYYGGIKGVFSIFEYQGQIGYSDNKNLALYLSDKSDKFRRFNVIYDTVGIVNFRGTVSVKPVKNMEIFGTFSQNIYSPKTQAVAWGLPSTDVNVGAKYWILPEAMIKASVFLQNGVNFVNAAGAPDRLQGLFDLNVGGEYWFLKNFGAFLDLNNILDLKRERWQNYPTYGINALAGVTARF